MFFDYSLNNRLFERIDEKSLITQKISKVEALVRLLGEAYIAPKLGSLLLSN